MSKQYECEIAFSNTDEHITHTVAMFTIDADCKEEAELGALMRAEDHIAWDYRDTVEVTSISEI